VEGEEARPGLQARDDHQLRGYVRRSVHTYFHYAGTCGMGADEDAGSTRSCGCGGVEGLRVIDASLVPSPADAGTNARVCVTADTRRALLHAQPTQ
jgi:choline dehydrogenase